MSGTHNVLSNAAASFVETASPLPAILAGTLVAGAMDISAAILIWSTRAVAPSRVLQSVAGGVLGREAFAGGVATAALGLLLHFAIMSVIVSLFVIASRRMLILTPRSLPLAIVCGVAYGVVVYLVMTYVVVPLSASASRAPSMPQFFEGVIVHILCVGIPIALIARHWTLRD